MYTKEQHTWLKENRPLYKAKELTKLFNETFGTSKSVSAIEHKCSNDRRLKKYDAYAPQELIWLQKNRDLYSDCELTTLFNKTFNRNKSVHNINRTCSRYKLKKTVVKKIGRSHRYSQEQIDWLKENRNNNTFKSLTILFNETFDENRNFYSITNCCIRNGIKK